MLRSLSLGLLALAAPLTGATAGEIQWKQHAINPTSAFEAAGVLDADGDGKLDVICGDTLYRAPDWERHKIRDVEKQGTYYNCFATLPMDVNGDGKMDYITVAYFTKNVGWVENPGELGKPWTYHEIDTPGPSETAWLVDLDGDGHPDILPNSVTTVAWYSLKKAASAPEWKKFDFGKEAAGHGVGSGDVNGDGRIDLLTPKGWFEAPKDPTNETWAWHPEWNIGATGIQILARDIDGDGLSDLVYGMGHDYGLFWLQQGKGTDGARTWTKHEIDPKITQAHALLWADIDGDGEANEIVTGKRVYAHEVEPGDTDASVIAWYSYDRGAKQWAKHTVFQGEPAANAPKKADERNAQKDFPPGTAGTGLQLTAIDLDGDGDMDLVCPGKTGLYWFENLSK